MANTTIQIKKSATPAATPAVLANGELAINYADGKLFYKAANGTIVAFSTSDGNDFGTINANGTLIVSDTQGDVLTIVPGNNITIVGDAVNDRVTIGLTNDVVVAGALYVKATGGDEGGQIELANAVTNSTVAGNVVIDIYQNKLRFFEKNSPNKGAFIDLSIAGSSVSTNLLATSGGTTDTTARATAEAAFAKANAALPNTNGVTFAGTLTASADLVADRIISLNNGNAENYKVGDDAWIGDTNVADTIRIKGIFNSANAYIAFGNNDGITLGRSGSGNLTYGGNTVWHAGIDGAGSGLDADLLDGQQGSYYSGIGSAAFDKANSANVLAYNTGIGANSYADSVGAGANAYMIAVQNGSNTAVGAGANNYANATFVKLIATSQTITGDITIVGNLSFSGNTTFSNVTTLQISDPLIYLAGNNYTSDLVDIGFIANYVNTTGSNVHTGLYREHENKMYYLFQGYDREPINNHIGAFSNNMTLAVLNADLITSNLTLGGVNAISWISSSYNTANAVGGAVTTANNIATAAFGKANGAAQLSFVTVAANGTNIVAVSNNDTLTLAATSNVAIVGNATSDTVTFDLRNTGVTASVYGNTTVIPVITVDSKGRLTSAANATASFLPLSGGTLTGNLTFSGTNLRVNGDFSNATVANRLLFQSSTGTFTDIGALAPGAAQTSGWTAYYGNDPTNTSRARMVAFSTDARFESSITGTGTYLPMTFYTGGSERMRIESNGNIGIGTSSPAQNLTVIGVANITSGLIVAGANVVPAIKAAFDQANTGGGGGASVAISDTAPSSPTANSLWWSSDLGKMFIYYNDGTSNQWVETSPSPDVSGIATALAIAGQAYDTAIAALANVTTAISVSGTIRDGKGDVRDIPISSVIVGYAIGLGDTGETISTNTTIYVPNATFGAGNTISVYNNSSASITITQNTGVTMYLGGTATTGNRTLAQRGLATIYCVAANTFVIGGLGVT